MMSLRTNGLTALLAGLLLLQGCGNTSLMTSTLPVAPGLSANGTASKLAPRYSNRVVIKFRSGIGESQMRSFQQRFSLKGIRTVSALGLGVMGLPEGRTANSVLNAIQGHPDIEYAEPDYVFSLPPVTAGARKAKASNAANAKNTSNTATPKAATRRVQAVGLMNDPGRENQWGLTTLGLDKVWGTNAGDRKLVVAVVDTGVDVRHPDLAANLVPGASMLANATGPDDDHGHGTHVAGIIAAVGNNRVGVSGVAPQCKIMPVKVLNREGQGDTGDIVAGILWAVNNGAKVINMSLGGTGGSRALLDAINYAQSKDVVLVAAMGNEGQNMQEYPAGYPGVIAVGSTDESDALSSFSNTGSWISVTAPGSEIYSTLPTHSVFLTETQGKDTHYDYLDGTSMASPFVAGLAALLRSQYPTMSAAAIKARIERTSDDLGEPGFDNEFGHGRINAARALLEK